MNVRSTALFTPLPGKSDRARERLLLAGLEVFGEKGPRGATVRDIAAAAGQNIAAIAYYFGSKEKLYHAVLEGVIREMRHKLGDVIGEMEAMRRAPERNPEAALRLLQKYFRAVFERLLSRSEAVAIGRLIIREQMQPTAAFEILYEQGFRAIHEGLSFLVGTVVGRDPRAQETIVRTHSLIGQMYFFVIARETILRRLGWKDLEGKNTALVADTLEKNIEALLLGLAADVSRKPKKT
jgi:AcrR family transcriptional regulator